MTTSRPLRDLSCLSAEEANTFLDSIDTVLVDCDGVLWIRSEALPGSMEVITKLKELGKKVFLVSNNCTKTVDHYVKLCSSYGTSVEREEVIIPSVVIAEYLKQRNFNGRAFVIGCKALKETFTELGVDFYSDTGKLGEPTLANFLDKLESLDFETGAVVLDFDLELDYLKLVQAVTLLKRTKAMFIVGATDWDVPVSEDVLLLGPGYFRSILETATKCEPIVAGKPSPIVADVISRRHTLVPERTLMIGDAMTQDVQLGTNCGFKTLLVLSGVSKLEDATRDPNNQPTFYTKTLGDLLPLLQ